MPSRCPAGAAATRRPGRKSSYCYWHDPDKADDLAEAQWLGGLHRKRERAIAAAYDFSGLASTDAVLRILEIAVTDALQLDNSIPGREF